MNVEYLIDYSQTGFQAPQLILSTLTLIPQSMKKFCIYPRQIFQNFSLLNNTNQLATIGRINFAVIKYKIDGDLRQQKTYFVIIFGHNFKHDIM